MIEGKRIFVTGASGFIGRAVLARLKNERCGKIVCLSRGSDKNIEALNETDVKWVRGNLLDPESYKSELQGSDAVIHLAASTGNATAEEHRLANFEGTNSLIGACKEIGVNRFVFVSTVAAGYKDLHDYPYARSKRDAETAVSESGLDSTIVRPTIVMGKGSGVGQSLLKFASLPLVPVFGQGNLMIQPIHVDDVARALVEVVSEPETIGKTLELGGQEKLSWNDWFRRMRNVAGLGKARILHLPLWIILPILRGLERIADGKLPVTAGQLSAFRHDGSVAGNRILDKIRAEMRDLDTMIRDSLSLEEPPPSNDADLNREITVFARHLVDRDVSDYLREAYLRAHRSGGPLADKPTGFEATLIQIASKGGLRLSASDAYVRLFMPTGMLRKKLVMVMALLENSPDGQDRFNLEDDVSPLTGIFRIMFTVARYAGLLFIGMLVFGPRHLIGGRR